MIVRSVAGERRGVRGAGGEGKRVEVRQSYKSRKERAGVGDQRAE